MINSVINMFVGNTLMSILYFSFAGSWQFKSHWSGPAKWGWLLTRLNEPCLTSKEIKRRESHVMCWRMEKWMREWSGGEKRYSLNQIYWEWVNDCNTWEAQWSFLLTKKKKKWTDAFWHRIKAKHSCRRNVSICLIKHGIRLVCNLRLWTGLVTTWDEFW